MSMRKTVILDEMIHLVGTKEELQKYENLYNVRNKGSATSYAMRIVRDHLILLVAKNKSTTPLSDRSGEERFIQFRDGNRVWVEKS